MLEPRLLKWALQALRLFGSTHSFSVLNYHRVMPATDLSNEQALSPELFSRQLAVLKQYFCVLSLPDAMARARLQQLPKNTVVITIDDGFADCYDFVFPLLQQHQLTATFFISTAGLEQGYLWENQISQAISQAPVSLKSVKMCEQEFSLASEDERRHSLLQLLELVKYQPLTERQHSIDALLAQTGQPVMQHQFVTEPQLQLMHQAGMTIGAHTVHHPILALETDEQARDEIAQSKARLEQITGSPIAYFAYPNGKFGVDFTDSHCDIVQQLGFTAAFSTDWGVADLAQSCPYRLRRFTPWDKDPLRFGLRLMLNQLADRSQLTIFKRRVRQDANAS